MTVPASVKEIAEVIGLEKALLLVSQLPRCYSRDSRWPGAVSGHVILYVPTLARLKPNHELVRILGWQDAVKMTREFGGIILQPAACTAIYRPFRDANIVRLVQEGMPMPLVADWFGVSERLVKNLVREIEVPVGENPQEEKRAANAQHATVKTPRRRKSERSTQAA
jgi:hypothetical protein